MKKLSIAVIITGALILSACNGNSNSSNSSDTTNSMSSTDTSMDMNAMNNSDTSQTVGDDAKNFTQEAASGGLFEVEMGNIAQRNGSSQSVKDFGKMMTDDHTQLNQDLQALAAKKNVPLPDGITDSQKDDTTKLSKEKGSEFDKDYISMMVKDHEKDIDAFKKAGDKITDQDYKDLITKALPVLQKHLDAAKAIKAKM